MCDVFGYACTCDYVKKDDPLFVRYEDLDNRVTVLERKWRPRDIANLR